MGRSGDVLPPGLPTGKDGGLNKSPTSGATSGPAARRRPPGRGTCVETYVELGDAAEGIRACGMAAWT